MREYQTKERKISEKIIDQMLAEGKIYEDAVKHNVIFIGCDPKGTVRYAGIRGTKEKYRGDAPGSEKAYGFSHTGTDDTLFVFEAPIDLLSFLSVTGDGWETHHYISLGGVSEKALMQYLADHKISERFISAWIMILPEMPLVRSLQKKSLTIRW